MCKKKMPRAFTQGSTGRRMRNMVCPKHSSALYLVPVCFTIPTLLKVN